MTVSLGANTEVAIPMKIASVATTITVSSETPLLDTRRVSSGSDFTQEQLKSIPTARDPWVVLQQVPSVQIDRANVAGSESGQQSVYIGKGVDPTQNAWLVDGVAVTDMSALGSSSTYYDFDAFQEMQATTGGSDPSIAVPGVTLNMVTKRGTNEVHGSARIFDTPQRDRSAPEPFGRRAVQRIARRAERPCMWAAVTRSTTSRTTAWKRADRSGPTRRGCGVATGAIRST